MTVLLLENFTDEHIAAQEEREVTGAIVEVAVPEIEVDEEFAVTIFVDVKDAELAGAVRKAEVAFPEGAGLRLAAEDADAIDSNEVEFAKLALTSELATKAPVNEVEVESTVAVGETVMVRRTVVVEEVAEAEEPVASVLVTVALTEETEETALESEAATLDNEARTEEALTEATEDADGRVIDEVMAER